MTAQDIIDSIITDQEELFNSLVKLQFTNHPSQQAVVTSTRQEGFADNCSNKLDSFSFCCPPDILFEQYIIASKFQLRQLAGQEMVKFLLEDMKIKDKIKIKEPEEISSNHLHGEIRGLMTSYPNEVSLTNSKDDISIIKDLDTIYNMLLYCEGKSTKPAIIEKIETEIYDLLYEIKLNDLMIIYRKYMNHNIEFGKTAIRAKISNMISENYSLIAEKIQYYLLCIPGKRKRNMHLPTAMGLPGSIATEFEQAEIGAGEKIKEGQSFKVEEGEVVAV